MTLPAVLSASKSSVGSMRLFTPVPSKPTRPREKLSVVPASEKEPRRRSKPPEIWGEAEVPPTWRLAAELGVEAVAADEDLAGGVGGEVEADEEGGAGGGGRLVARVG